MYQQYFGLRALPFSIAPDPHYLYLSSQHREALAHLLYGVGSGGGFVLLTGEVGTGKTTVCRCLLQQLPEKTEVAYIVNPCQSPVELLSTICDELGVPGEPGNTSIKYQTDRLMRHLLEAHGRGFRTVALIDEAQNLDADVLEQIRLLTNLETDDCKLLQLVLIGQPELNDKLAQPGLRQFAQRVTARYHLRELDLRDTRAYINHRLAVVGLYEPLFPEWSVRKLYRVSGGVPRLINILCDRVMLGVYAENAKAVEKRHLAGAIREVLPPGQTESTGGSHRWLWAGLTVALLLDLVVYLRGTPVWHELIRPAITSASEG